MAEILDIGRNAKFGWLERGVSMIRLTRGMAMCELGVGSTSGNLWYGDVQIRPSEPNLEGNPSTTRDVIVTII